MVRIKVDDVITINKRTKKAIKFAKEKKGFAKRTGGAPGARKESTAQLRKAAQDLKKAHCPPPTSRLNRAQLTYLKTHSR